MTASKMSSRHPKAISFRLLGMKITPNRLWGGLFAFWGLFLTGVTWSLTGSPGILQQARLSSLLGLKQADLTALETEIAALDAESDRLEKSSIAQEREVRKVLGYAAPDEMIFDFSAAQFSSQKSEAMMAEAARTKSLLSARLLPSKKKL